MTPKPSAVVGKRVLVSVTCIDPEEQLLSQFQMHGIVTDVNDENILLEKRDGSKFGLPPVLELLDPAEPGVYTLKATGESVEDPDFLASLTVTIKDPSSLREVETPGFAPAES